MKVSGVGAVEDLRMVREVEGAQPMGPGKKRRRAERGEAGRETWRMRRGSEQWRGGEEPKSHKGDSPRES